MSALTDRLETLAHDAIREHGEQCAAGGEPTYPTWADDVLELCLQINSMAGTLDIIWQLTDAAATIVMFKEQAQ